MVSFQLSQQSLVFHVELLALFAPSGVLVGELVLLVEVDCGMVGLFEVGEESSAIGFLELLLLPDGCKFEALFGLLNCLFFLIG